MQTALFDYDLPPALIAQTPLSRRDHSRLLVLHRHDGCLEHRQFATVPEYLRPGDVLVLNDSRVMLARLQARKATGGRVELLLLQPIEPARWQVLVGGRRVRAGTSLTLLDRSGRPAGMTAVVTAELDGAQREVTFSRPASDWLDALGHAPLPPYIHEALADPERYQTVYARHPGSAAAPTAGLHFTPELLISLRDAGVRLEMVTLHIGLDTFQPVAAAEVPAHTIHTEWAELTPDSARRINEAKLAGGRIFAVGTTAVRTLETAALRSAGLTGSLQDISRRDAAGEVPQICPWRPVAAFAAPTDLFIYPGYRFRAVDGLITNFHLPRSTLLMLVSAFAGREQILSSYQEAVDHQYRFYSFGDAMLIL